MLKITGTEEKLMREVLAAKTTQGVKDRFMQACEDNPANPNYNKRELAVATQYNRNSWQIDDRFGRILIEKSKHKYPKISGSFFTYRLYAWFHMTGRIMITLSKDEYEEMEKAYFGKFTFDQKYLNKLNSLK